MGYYCKFTPTIAYNKFFYTPYICIFSQINNFLFDWPNVFEKDYQDIFEEIVRNLIIEIMNNI